MCYVSAVALDSFLLKVDKLGNFLNFYNCILTMLSLYR